MTRAFPVQETAAGGACFERAGRSGRESAAT